MPVYALYERMHTELVTPHVEYLRSSGLICLVDTVDTRRMSSSTIRISVPDRIKGSNHMLLFLGESDNGSWWVPLAVGAAQIRKCRTVLFRLESGVHQPCLTDLPDMNSAEELQSFIECYRQDASVPFKEARNTFQPLDTPDLFYRKLRSKLRRQHWTD